MKQKQAPQPAFKVGDIVKRISESFLEVKKGKTYIVEAIKESGDIELKGLVGTYIRNKFELVYRFTLGTAHIRATRNGGFRTTLVGKNGEVMFTSEVYTTKAMAKKTLKQFPDFEVIDETKKK